MAISADHATSLEGDEPAPREAPQCGVARCAEIVSGKWTLLLVRDLLGGPRSFSELEESLAGISPRTLCDRLKLLAAEGLVTRTRIKGLPPRTIYELTEDGHSLGPLIAHMRDVGERLLDRRLRIEPDEAITGDECCA